MKNITEVEFEIDRLIFNEKKYCEKLVGVFSFDWFFSKIYYSADCTIGIPFDLFDKVIVGILLIDESLSIEQLGEILGFNIIDNPSEQQYKDNAEYDILRMALDSLKQYEMIEISDIDYSKCYLTSLGKDYAKKGMKFRYEPKKEFALYYDHTGGMHKDLGEFFMKQNSSAEDRLFEGFDFLDENLMELIAEKQEPSICNPSLGNTFVNPQMIHNKSKTYKLEIVIAVIYDYSSENIRLLAYDHNTKKIVDLFTKFVNGDAKNKIIREWLGQLPYQALSTNEEKKYKEQQDYLVAEQQKIEEDDNYAGLLMEDKSIEHKDVTAFFNRISLCIPLDAIEIWFFIPSEYLQLSQFKIALQKFIKEIASKESGCFVFYVLEENEESGIESFGKEIISMNSPCFFVSVVSSIDFLSVWVKEKDNNTILKYQTEPYFFKTELDGVYVKGKDYWTLYK